MAVRRLSLFLPRDTPFYRGLLGQMRRGFEAEGVTTSGLCRHLGPDELGAWCNQHRPDAVFEMNRPRCEVPFLPRTIRHIVWLVDFGGRSLAHFEGSDITYLFGPSWVDRYPHRGFHRWFGPGACPTDYPLSVPPVETEVAVAFAGHIPRPWSADELARDMGDADAPLLFGDLLPPLERAFRLARGELRSADDFITLSEATAGRSLAAALDRHPTLRYDLSGRIIRMINRHDLIDAALASSPSLALYGPDSWQQWPAYAPHYRGFLSTPAELGHAYRSAAVTLHEGNGIHFRSLDCLCAGGVLFFRETPHDTRPGGIRTLFEPHVHYVPFTLPTLAAELEPVLADPQRRRAMGEAAAAVIRAGHTWRHRAQEVLRDLRDL